MAPLLLFFVALVMTFGDSSPLELSGETLQEAIDKGQTVFVKFYAPWCGHCKSLAPTWDQLADQYTGSNIVIAKVDCTTHTAVCADHGVKGYPTLKLFRGGDVWDHRNARDLKTLSDFITSHVGDTQIQKVQPKILTDATFQDYISTTPGLHFVKFYAPWCGHCQHLAPVWEELAGQYDDSSVLISKVDCTQETVTCGRLEVKGYPTLLLFVNGVLVDKYSGSRDLASLTQFLSEALQTEAPPVKGVVKLTGDNFGPALIENKVVFVKFYAPWCGHCKSLAPTWEELAEAVHGSLSDTMVAKVDCTEDRELCSEQQVHGYPTLLLFKDGHRSDYREARDLNSLLNFVQDNSK